MEQETTSEITSQTFSQKRSRGRPKKDLQALTSAGIHWADHLTQLYSEGAQDAEVCKALKLSHRQFSDRERNDVLFAELVEAGRLAAKAWWLELGRKHAKLGAGSQSFSFWYAYMKNVYGWSDKSEAQVEIAKNMSTDDINARLRAIQNKIKKLPANAEMKALLNNDA